MGVIDIFMSFFDIFLQLRLSHIMKVAQMLIPYEIEYLKKSDYYFPRQDVDSNTYPLFRVARETWSAGSSYYVDEQPGVTWMQVSAGEGTWQIGSHQGEFKQGTLLCYGLKTSCHLVVKQQLEHQLIYTHPSGARLAKEYGIMPGTVISLTSAAAPCWNLLTQIVDSVLSSVLGKQRIAHALFHAWLNWLASVHRPEHMTPALALQAREWVDSNLEIISSIDDVATFCCCSTEHLSRVFRAEYQESLGHYIRHRQMRLAADILRAESVSIDEVAEKFGYSERYSFTKAFKRCNGISPGKIRRLQR